MPDQKFTGQRLDSTGLYYYGARYYDATIGRFISADTIVPKLSNPQALNRYSYVYNNPLRYKDPTGHFGLGDVVDAISDAIDAIADVVASAVETVGSALGSAGEAIANGAQAVGEAISGAAHAAADLAEDIGNSVEAALGITNIEVKGEGRAGPPGYLAVDVSEESPIARAMDSLNIVGITIPSTPIGPPSVVVIRAGGAGEDLPGLRAHEEAHVVQEFILGPAFLPMYGIAEIIGLIPGVDNVFEWAAQLESEYP